MTLVELVALCDQAIEAGIGLRLVTPRQRQPLPGFRGELVCVNDKGEAVYLYTAKQVRRMRRELGPYAAPPAPKDYPAIGVPCCGDCVDRVNPPRWEPSEGRPARCALCGRHTEYRVLRVGAA